MATLVKQPKTGRKGNGKGRTGRSGRPVSPLPRGRRLQQRLRYWFRHPLNAAWGWLSSVRTAILLISLITLICFLGIYFVQAPGEVVGDVNAYSAWVQLNALPRYGSLTPIFNWLQFFTIFSSWYFLLLLTVLSLSIVVCTLNRAPAIWQNFRHPLLRRSDKFYENALERGSFSQADAVNWTKAFLRKRGYRVRSVVETGEGTNTKEQAEKHEVVYLYANKNSWATLSTFLFHAALVTLLMAGVLSLWHGFAPGSLARKLLPAPIVAFTDSLAGFSFDVALPNGQSAVVYSRGTPHNISFRANKFTATFDPKTGTPTDYVTDLSVYQDGEQVAQSDHLRVNDPLSYNGIVFHQSSLIPSVNLTIADANGCLLCNQAIVLDQSATLPSGLVADYANGVPIAGSNLTVGVFFAHVANAQLAQIARPMVLVTVGLPGATPTQGEQVLRLLPGQAGTINKNWTIKLNSATEASVLLVTKDTGSLLIWPTAVVLILSLCATFYFPQRRIWLRISGQRVQMAALREHFTNIRTDLLALERAAVGYT